MLIHAYIHARYQQVVPVGRGTLEAIFNGCEVTLDRLGDEDIQGRLRIDDASMAWGMAWMAWGWVPAGGLTKMGDLNFEVSLFSWYPGKNQDWNAEKLLVRSQAGRNSAFL